MRGDQAITKYRRFQKEGGRTHIISSQIVNHQVPNFQRTPEGYRQMMFRQQTEKSRKNASYLLLNLRTNSKVEFQIKVEKTFDQHSRLR